jgi:estrone sulfotransferase
MISATLGRARQLLRFANGLRGLRRSDVILTSFPKSGNTWVRFFLCHLADAMEGREEFTGFDRLDRVMPEFGISDLRVPHRHAQLPRFVKTHGPHLPVFRGLRAVLVVRDPRDAMLSLHHYEMHRLKPRVPADLSELVRHPRYGFAAWFRHTRGWLRAADVVMRYEDLRRDDVAEFTRMLNALQLDVDAGLIAAAANRSKFEKVREAEQAERDRPARSEFAPVFTFARAGESGTGKSVLSAADLDYYQQLKREYGLDLY